MLTRRSLWVFLLALLVASAGVIAAVQAFGGGSQPIVLNEVESGSLPHFAAAESLAEAWDADAFLVMVHATEGKPLEGRVDPPLLYDTGPDPIVGNGRAVAWTFSFASPARPDREFYVTVGGDGTVLYQRALPSPFSRCCEAPAHASSSSDGAVVVSSSSVEAQRPGIGRPALDADEAFSRVAERPEFASFAADHPVFQAFVALMPGPEGGPAWSITYRTATVFAADAVVDATDGTVRHVSAWPGYQPPCCDPNPEPPTPPEPTPCCPADDHHASYRATLGPSRPTHTVSFPVESPRFAREARVSVTLDPTLPLVGDAVLQVYDGDMRPLARAAGAGALEVVLHGFPSQGVYRAELSLPQPLADVGAEVAVEVLYDPTPHALPPAYVFQGASSPWGGQTYVSLWFQEQGVPTSLALRWDAASPLDDLELVLLDAYGNEVATARGAGEATLDVPAGSDCCMTAVLRNVVNGPSQVPFELTVEVAPWENGPWQGHPVYRMH